MEIQTTKRPRKAAGTPAAASTMRDDVRAFKREIILASAIDAFYAQGFENTSVDDIAAAMSVTKAVLYYNFSSKMRVLEEIVDRTSVRSLEAIERGIAEGNTPAQQLALCAYYASTHILLHQKMVAIYFREEQSFAPDLLERTRNIERRCTERVRAILDAGVDAGAFRMSDSELTALNIIGMIAQAFYWYRDDGRLSRDAIARQSSEAALALVRFQGELGLSDGAYRAP